MTAFIVGMIANDPCYESKFRATEKYLKSIPVDSVLSPIAIPQIAFQKEKALRLYLEMINCSDVIYILPDFVHDEAARIQENYARYCGKPTFYPSWKEIGYD